MKRFLQFCVAIVLLHFGALAQTTSKVTIELKNNGFSLDSFVVYLQNGEQTKAEHKYKDTNISVIVPKAQKKVYIKVLSKTYMDIDTIYSVSPNIIIELTKKPEEIKEVVVTSYKKIRSGDNLKQIFKIDPKTISNITNAEMALKRTPGLYYLDGGIRILGANKNAVIYIDDLKASTLDLESLRASEIEQIEVEPSLNSMVGGVIRIYKKKVTNTNYRVNIKDTEGFIKETMHSPSIDMSYQTKTFYISSNVSFTPSTQSSSSTRNITPKGGNTKEYNTDVEMNMQQMNAGIKMSWQPTKKSTFLFSASTYYQTSKDKNKVSFLDKTFNQELYDKYNPYWINASYKYKINRGVIGITNSTTYVKFATTGVGNKGNNKTDYLEDQIYLYFYKGFTLFNRNGYYAAAYGYSNRGNIMEKDNTQHINSLIAKTYYKLADRLSIRGAIEFEHSYLSTLNKYYFNINPEVALSYNASGNSYTLSYSKYVIRPSGYEVNPELSQTSTTSTREGNRYLVPSTYNDLQFRYSRQIKDGYISLVAEYERANDIIGEVDKDISLSTDYRIKSKFENIGLHNKYSLSLGMYKPLLDHKMTINLNLTGSYTKFDLYPEIEKYSFNISDGGYNVRGILNVSYVPAKNWDLYMNILYQPVVYKLNAQVYMTPYITIGAKRSFLDGKLVTGISTRNPFWNNNSRFISEQRAYTSTAMSKNYTSKIFVSLSFMFGQYFNEKRVSIESGRNDTNISRE